MGEDNNGMYGRLGEIVILGERNRKIFMNMGGIIFNEDLNNFFTFNQDGNRLPPIKKVIFSGPATIVLWGDDSPKTVVKLQSGDHYSKELGLAMCICKKALGNKGKYNNIFHEWVYSQEDEEEDEKFEDPFRDITDIDQFLKSILF